MKRKLYPNMKRMTTLFCIAIICVTLTTLTLRLAVLGDLSNGLGSVGTTQMENGQFSYVIARRVNFSSPDALGDFRIENPETNEYYMMVSVLHPDTGQEIFYTGIIRPGESRRQAALHIRLPAGVHETTARVTAHDPATLEQRGSKEQNITLHIG